MTLGDWIDKSGQPDDEKRFHELYVREYERLFRYACALLRSKRSGGAVESKAEVAVQETFTAAWKKREEVFSWDNPAGWLYGAIQFKVKDIFKEDYKWTKLLLRYESVYSEPVEPHISLETEFYGVIETEEFDLLRRVYQEGYSYREVCLEEDLSISALASRLHRIKAKLRESLDE